MAQNIFTDCIQGYLAHKARILVTHQLHFTAGLKKILALDSVGKQSFIGNYDELMHSGVSDIVKILESFRGRQPFQEESTLNCKEEQEDPRRDNRRGEWMLVSLDSQTDNLESFLH